MVSAYDVLGVASGSDRAEIRAAYVNLAKQLHPDQNAGSLQAEQHLREVNQAYELLKDPERRAIYDQLLQQSRGQTSQRRKRAAAVMVASFVLTAAGVAFALMLARFSLLDDTVQAGGSSEVVWRSEDQASALRMASLDPVVGTRRDPDVRIKSPARDIPARSPTDASEAQTLVAQRLAALQAQDQAGWEPIDPAAQHEWITYHNDRFGFVIDYPADVFVADDRTLGDFWRLFVSRDGKARLLVTAGFNSKRLTTAAYRQSVLSESYQAALVEYAPLRPTWFVLAGNKGEEGFYERATFACDGRIIHRWRLTYPVGERNFYSQIIERIHQGYKHVRGSGPHCG